MAVFFDLTSANDIKFLQPGELAFASLGLRSLGGDDSVQGSSSNESIYGNSGNDTLLGGNGNDILQGGQGDDRLDGQENDDSLFGNRGNDTLFGGNGNDWLLGGQDNDRLFGNAGNDTLVGDFGADNLLGQGGADTFVFRTDSAVIGLVNADVTLDFRISDGDRIGLDERSKSVELLFDDRLDLSNIFGGTGSPDTIISVVGSGVILGVVLDTPRSDVISRIDLVSNSLPV